jgi:hypothetical protein
MLLAVVCQVITNPLPHIHSYVSCCASGAGPHVYAIC